MAPQLPARKAGGRRAAGVNPSARGNQQLPIAFASEIELPDGTKIPIKIPPGMPPHQAQALIAYLQSNPDAAKQVHQQAQEMMKTPGMAHAFMNMQSRMQDPDMLEKYQVLKDDPELKVIFDDVVANGPSAFAKYWDDVDLMTKVSAKLRAAKLGNAPATKEEGEQEEGEGAEGGDAKAPRKTGPAAGAPPADVHDAAKKGDVEALKAFLEQEGASVNSKNERGITVLGVAVGFNREAVVDELLARGADLEAQDPAGNTVLFYAAGYGRLSLAKKLLAAGADINATNKAGQKPIDAAKMNGEKSVVKFLQEHAADAEGEEAKKQDA